MSQAPFPYSKTDPSGFPFVSTIISALIERRTENGEVQLLLQTRCNKNDKVYNGTLEIPAGHIDKFENVYDTLEREVLEETGLRLIEVLDNEQTAELSGQGDDAAIAFKPFVCQQYLRGRGWSWIGFVFRCRVDEGKKLATDGEAEGQHWVSVADLKTALLDDPSRFFTLQLPVLKYYVDFHEKKIQ